ncbi:MAG: hypothetical protein KGK07_16200 [Chloroflexota bacterium]|nr:hypothetical protein [Chloroflexota bacterium]
MSDAPQRAPVDGGLITVRCPRCGRWLCETDATRLRMICKCGLAVALVGRRGGEVIIATIAKRRRPGVR